VQLPPSEDSGGGDDEDCFEDEESFFGPLFNQLLCLKFLIKDGFNNFLYV
jgi:hypothetical protein